MAGNKFDTQFNKHIPKTYHVLFNDQNGDPVIWHGSAKQIINNIIQQQL